MKGKNRLEEIIEVLRSQLSGPVSVAKWSASLPSDLSPPGDGSPAESWNRLAHTLENYENTGETEFLWQAAGELQPLVKWYLNRPVTLLSGIGKKRAEALENLEIQKLADLLFHFPRAYTDRRYVDDISDVTQEKYYTLYGEVLATDVTRGRNPRFEIRLGDDTGYIRINFWNQTYLSNKIKPGDRLFCYGKAEFFRGNPQLNNPEFDLIESSDELDSSRRLKPVYPLTEGVSQHLLRSWVKEAIQLCRGLFLDGLPPVVRESQSLPPLGWSLQQVHQPETKTALNKARRRLIFGEFFFFQLIFALHNWRVESITKDRNYPDTSWRDRFVENLPFELTADQQEVLAEIEADLCTDSPVHRLLQGDVGTGKTVVAAAALLRVAENGYQTAFMAPTEVLAEQHFSNLESYFAGLPCEVKLLTGSLSRAEKEQIQARVNRGEIDLVVGTHALVQDQVEFSSLGFVVIDEQHRFGVEQRRSLREKGPEVDMLIMSATPIPRSLALTVYGDLDVSSLEEFPEEERDIDTRVFAKTKLNRRDVYKRVRRLVKNGGRAFFIFPAIEDNEETDLTAAETAYQKAMESHFFENIDLGLLHGQMGSEQKQSVMEKFRRGEIQLLFSTTVVEVGVDVPEASCLVVFEAERFGLAQLHQLRGRIGRAGQQAYCFLLVSTDVAPGSRERLEVMEQTEDGFEVARRDLRFRGIGAPTGTRQSGLQEFKLGNIWDDRELMKKARRAAVDLVERSAGLESPELVLTREKLHSEYEEQLKFARIG